MDRPHLFVDISSHGFGHLAQVAPVLDALRRHLPALRLSIRSGLPTDKLRARIPDHYSAHSPTDFTHLPESSDFGYVMHDAVSLDLDATALAYRRQHADWDRLVERDARLFSELKPNLVLSDVSYLPLAGAARAGIPSVVMCSLNWAELFAHFFASEEWAATIHRQMLDAYNGAECFLRVTPGMAMADLPRLRAIGPIATLGADCRQELRAQLGCDSKDRLVLIAFGGVNKRLPVDHWPPLIGLRWLVPQAWQLDQPGFTAFEPLGRPITDLLRAADAVLTKPGYGTFAEAACNGTPLLYLRRENWPEQDFLIDWLQEHGRCREVSDADPLAGRLQPALEALWSQAVPALPQPSGAEEAAAALLPWLATDSAA